jgi:2-hydroxy-6-oxonona-2,4-dienedioate hydrolase
MHAEVLGMNQAEGSPAFVLVHGLGMSSLYFMPTARRLALHGKVYVPDLPGFGRSGKPDHPLTIPGLSDALAGWLDHHQLGPVLLIGNSLGAQVIIDLAVRYPRRLAGVVLVSPTVDPAARSIGAQTLRLMADVWEEPPSLYWIGLTDYWRAGFRTMHHTLRHALADPVLDKLPRIGVPTLLVRGGRDPIVPQSWIEQAARLIPGARLVVLPGAAHAVNYNSPDALVDLVLGFMGKTVSSQVYLQDEQHPSDLGSSSAQNLIALQAGNAG